ncbi:hypothetical protein HDU92_007755 [Lobulomyces angularis]|nr:hypothetical protein HDU92_007755 [Lobulomyces angularis]
MSEDFADIFTIMQLVSVQEKYIEEVRKKIDSSDIKSSIATYKTIDDYIANIFDPHAIYKSVYYERRNLASKKILDNISSKGSKYSICSTTMICPSCGGNNIGSTQKQDRGLDEGMSTYYTCNSCSKTWK